MFDSLGQIQFLHSTSFSLKLDNRLTSEVDSNDRASTEFNAPEIDRIAPGSNAKAWQQVSHSWLLNVITCCLTSVCQAHLFSLGLTLFHAADYGLPHDSDPSVSPHLVLDPDRHLLAGWARA